MRVFLCSVPDELECHRQVAVDVVRELGHEPVLRELRRFKPPAPPAQPYPLLLPYTHPDFMAGRDGPGLRAPS